MSASTDEKGPAEKLHLLKSPLTNITHTNYSNDTHDASGVRPNLEAFGDRYGAHNDSPTFQRVRSIQQSSALPLYTLRIIYCHSC